MKQVEKQKAAEIKRKKEKKKRKMEAEKQRKKKIAADKKRAVKQKKEAEKKRTLEAERKRKQKIAEEKQKKKEAERKRKLAEEKAAQEALERELEMQMADEMESLNQANQQHRLSEVGKYNLLISNKIKRNWIEPEQKGACKFKINLTPGGLVIGVTVIGGDQLHCESGRRAILKSEPLPVASDPEVFNILRTRTFELENKSEKEVFNE
ncbi:MAG: cell envelope integrity protein TolA [Enterobacterales bacterium]|nr:cell envelope integrity protein TolA [Enterobacterales bacterium]